MGLPFEGNARTYDQVLEVTIRQGHHQCKWHLLSPPSRALSGTN